MQWGSVKRPQLPDGAAKGSAVTLGQSLAACEAAKVSLSLDLGTSLGSDSAVQAFLGKPEKNPAVCRICMLLKIVKALPKNYLAIGEKVTHSFKQMQLICIVNLQHI